MKIGNKENKQFQTKNTFINSENCNEKVIVKERKNMRNSIISTFCEWLEQTGRTTLTIASYASDVKAFLSFLESHKIDENVIFTRYLFKSFKDELVDSNRAITTVNKAVNSLKVFNDFLIKQGIVKEQCINLKQDRVKIAYGSEKEIEVLTEQQVQQVLFYLQKESQRNQLIFLMLLYTGVRASELISIQKRDLDRLTEQLIVLGKGGKQRKIPLRKEILEAIEGYLEGERAASKFSDSPYLLVSQRSEKMHREAVRKMLQRVGEKLGFPIYTHMLRHTFATRLIEKGVDVITVSKLCGHSSIDITTRFYINISNELKMEAVYKI